MCGSCSVRIDDVWLRLQANQVFRTPDYTQGVRFTIAQVSPTAITIAHQNIPINRVSFADALHYLRENHHHTLNPCTIGSNDDPNLAGPLCCAARQNNQSRHDD